MSTPSAALSPAPLQKGRVWTLSGAHLMNDLMTSGVVPALMPLYKSAFHLTYTQAGLVVLVSYLTSSVSQPLFGVLSDRRPQAWLLPFGLLLVGVGLSLSGVVPSYPLLLLAVALSGIGSGVFHPEASRGAHLAAGSAKGTAQSIFQVGGNAGQALGPLAVPLLRAYTGIHGLLWFLVVGVLAFLLTIRLVPWYKANARGQAGSRAVRAGQDRPWAMALLTVAIIARAWAQVGIPAFLPFFYEEQHVSLDQGEIYSFLFLGAGAVATLLGGPLSDRFGRKWLMVGTTLLAVPFAWLLPHTHGIWAAVDLVLLGFCMLATFAVTVVYGQMLLPGRIGLASGLVIGLGIGAAGVGAAFMGGLADRFGVPFIIHMYVILPALAAVLFALLPSDRALAAGSARS
ncbi:MFS transporter [Alicyclobacillus kakegawensis]|uniref:MFS transporter n=1 Tax=Alicyclobacillus kakegawensis TaxID=392012 RepID=UPI000836D8FF|nr:MFS transporter [Alicyclobacillus kakegawensis]